MERKTYICLCLSLDSSQVALCTRGSAESQICQDHCYMLQGEPVTSAVTVFEISAEEVGVLSIGSLGGCLEASALSLDAKGLTVTGGTERACLLHCPISPQGLATGLSVLHAQR